MRRTVSHHRLFIFFLLLNTPALAASTSLAESESFDCGTLALFTLLRADGKTVRLAEVVSSLPSPVQGGFSVDDICRAARRMGLDVFPTRLQPGKCPDRPALAFLRAGTNRHFLVVRPVGHSGRLLQVIDSRGTPFVVEAEEFLASPQWTGIVIIPRRLDWTLVLSTCTALGAAVGIGLCWIRLQGIGSG